MVIKKINKQLVHWPHWNKQPCGPRPQAAPRLQSRAGKGTLVWGCRSGASLTGLYPTQPEGPHPKLMSLASQRGKDFEVIFKVADAGELPIT